MNTPADQQDERLHEEASLWSARLDGSDLADADRRALAAWLAGDPRRRAILSEYCQFSLDLETRLATPAASGTLPLPEPESPVATRRRLRRTLIIGLAAAACIALGFWLWPAGSQFENLATPAGQRQSLDLVDGSRIALNARTSLRVEINGHQRQVRLAGGEAFFTVSKDPARPFVVETPAGSIRVTGTEFDVSSTDPSSLLVTVLRGVVQVSPAGADARPVTLRVGDQLSVAADGVTRRELSAQQLQDLLAWRQGQVVFHGETLDGALRYFARYHGVDITVTPEAAKLRVGGRFSLDDLNGFFSALEEVLPVRISRNLNGTVLVELRPAPARAAS